MTDDDGVRAAAAAGAARLGGRLPRAAPVDRRRRAGDLLGARLFRLPPRRGDRRARLRGGLGRGRGRARRAALPREHRDRRLGARHAAAARARRPRSGPPLRARRRRGDGLRAARADGGPAARTSERALGVLEVLDRPPEQPFTLAEMELLGRFATQAAIALDLLGRMRRARASLAGGGGGRFAGSSAGGAARGGRRRRCPAPARGARGRPLQPDRLADARGSSATAAAKADAHGRECGRLPGSLRVADLRGADPRLR